MIKAVVFDMDGLMVDSEGLFIKCVREYNKVSKIKVPIKIIKENVGLSYEGMNEVLTKLLGKDFNVKEFRKKQSKIWDNYVLKNGLDKKKGTTRLIQFLKKNNIPIAVASNSKTDELKTKLKQAGLDENLFDFVVGVDMVKRAKPKPDIYIKTCKLLKLKPNEVFVLEDSFNGVRAGAGAGCKVIMVPDTLQPHEEINKLIFKRFNNLIEVKHYFESII